MTSLGRPARTVYLAGLAQGLVGAAFPASAVVLRGQGLSDAQYGSLFVPQMALAALGATAGSWVMRGLGARRALAFGVLLMGLSQAALLIAGHAHDARAFAVALVGTSLLGLGAGIAAGPVNAYPQLLFPRQAESAVLALHVTTGAGLALSPLLAGAALTGGWWAGFPVLLLGLHLLLAPRIAQEDLPRAEPDHDETAARQPFGSTALWLFLSIALLYGLTESQFGSWGIVFLVEERGLGAAAAGAAAAAFWACVALGRFGVAGLVLRVPPGPVLPALASLMALSCLLVPLADGPRGALLVFALGGLGCGAVFPLSLALASRRFPRQRARVSSLLYAALVSGLGIGSFATGLLRPAIGLGRIYRLGALPPALACLLALAALRAARPPVRAASLLPGSHPPVV